jgi:peptidoglycan/xylan/chitin deacetylase (PgdA/CDA1 family)
MVNRDETGREIIYYPETGKRYFIEYLPPKGYRTDWGSYNPSTGNIENKKGTGKYNGGIRKEDSMITKENGFDEIIFGSGSPYSTIDEMHRKWKKENGY